MSPNSITSITSKSLKLHHALCNKNVAKKSTFHAAIYDFWWYSQRSLRKNALDEGTPTRNRIFDQYCMITWKQCEIEYTGWRRINRTIQPFNRVYENMHKRAHLTVVAHRQIRIRRKKCAFKFSAVINILCDVIADVVDVNKKTRPLTSEIKHKFVRCELKKDGDWGAPPNSPGLNRMDYLIWEALHQLIYRPRRIRDVEHLKEVLQTCWEQIGQDVIDRAIGQFRKRLSLVVATGGGHIQHCFD